MYKEIEEPEDYITKIDAVKENLKSAIECIRFEDLLEDEQKYIKDHLAEYTAIQDKNDSIYSVNGLGLNQYAHELVKTIDPTSYAVGFSEWLHFEAEDICDDFSKTEEEMHDITYQDAESIFDSHGESLINRYNEMLNDIAEISDDHKEVNIGSTSITIDDIINEEEYEKFFDWDAIKAETPRFDMEDEDNIEALEENRFDDIPGVHSVIEGDKKEELQGHMDAIEALAVDLSISVSQADDVDFDVECYLGNLEENFPEIEAKIADREKNLMSQDVSTDHSKRRSPSL